MSELAIKHCAVVGPTVLSEKHTLEWTIIDFAALPQQRNDKVGGISALTCLGHSWSLNLYPRGNDLSSEETEYVSLFLKKVADVETVRVNFEIRVGNRRKIGPEGVKISKDHGWKKFCTRDELLAELAVDGSLLIEVDIQMHVDKQQALLPRSTILDDMLRLLDSGKGSDVSFAVGGKVFRAHSGILAMRAPILAELADISASETNVLIEGVDEVIFNALLRNVYAEEYPSDNLMKDKGRELLDAADYFGCSSLKLFSESKLVQAGATAETAAELIEYADRKSCAHLKETALDYFRANSAAVMRSSGWANIESPVLLKEIVAALVPTSSRTDNKDDINRVSVLDLRRQLQELKLGEDGTREMLAERLKKNKTEKSAED